jgi:hypothetical protein
MRERETKGTEAAHMRFLITLLGDRIPKRREECYIPRVTPCKMVELYSPYGGT